MSEGTHTSESRGVEMTAVICTRNRPDLIGQAVQTVLANDHPDFELRTVETKHASGQLIHGTVVSEEYPGSPARHYPVPTIDRRY